MKKRQGATMALSLFLALAMIFGVSPPAKALSASDAARRGSDVYQAWYVINYTDYRYFANDYQGPYRMWVNDLRKQSDWNAKLAAWRVATFDGKSEASYFTDEIGYYDTLLFTILYDEESASFGTSMLGEAAGMVGDVTNAWKKISASTWKDLCELDSTLNDEWELTDDDKTRNFLENLTSNQNIADSMKLIGKASKYLGYCKTGLEMVEKISKVEALLQQSEEVALIFQEMASKSTGNLVLDASLHDYAQYVSGTMTEAEVQALFAGQITAEKAAENLAGKAWGSLLDLCGQYGTAVKIGQSVGTFAADFLLNTSEVVSQFYKLEAMCNFEDVLLAEVRSCQSAFESNPTPQNAKKFIAAYRMLYKSFAKGLDYSDGFVKALFEDGWVNKLRNSWTGDAKYKEILASIGRLKSSVEWSLKTYERLSYNAYLDDLASIPTGATAVAAVSISSVTPMEGSVEQQIEIVHTEAEKLSDIVVTSNRKLEHDTTIYGSLTVKSGTLDLNGHTLRVEGYVLHSGGTITFNGGTLNVSGDYHAQGITTDSVGNQSYTEGSGYWNMQYDNDLLSIHGDFIANGSNYLGSSSVKKGKIVLYKNVDIIYQYGPQSGSETVVTFAGNKTHQVSCQSGYIRNLETPASETVEWSGKLNLYNPKDNCRITSKNAVIKEMALNGTTLTITGDTQIDGSINCHLGKLIFKNDVLHSSGTITFEGGTVDIGGDYRSQKIQTSTTGDSSYTYGSGSLNMKNDSDTMIVKGNVYVHGNSNTLTAGTLYMAGDVTVLNSSFRASGTHTTILNGTGKVQKITFPSTSDGFNILQLTRSSQYYQFTPETCWKTMKVKGVVVSKLAWSQSKDKLTGTLNCEETLVGKKATLIVAFYNAKGALLDTWTQNVTLSDGMSLSIGGKAVNASKSQLMIVEQGSLVPLGVKTELPK